MALPKKKKLLLKKKTINTNKVPIIISFGQKGGTGKTEFSRTLAYYFSEIKNEKVLCIDADAQGNFTMAFNAINLDRPSLFELVVGQEYFKIPIRDENNNIIGYENVPMEVTVNNTIVHVNENIDLIPADIRMCILAFKTISFKDSLLKKILDQIDMSQYSAVIIDLGAGFGDMHVASLAIANYIVMPIQLEPNAVDGAVQMPYIIDLARKHLNNPDLDISAVIGTLYTPNRNIQKESIKKLEEFFGDQFLGLISRSTTVIESNTAKKSIFAYSPSSKSAKEFTEICEKIYQEIKNKEI